MHTDILLKFDLALKKRSDLLDKSNNHTNAFRLIHSLGDDFEGLTVDKLGSVILVEKHSSKVDANPLVDAITARFGPDASIFLKERWSPDKVLRSGAIVAGPRHNGLVQVLELGLLYNLNLCDDEHIGLFLDSRSIRKHVCEISKNKRVLNLFSYTGGFGMSAQSGGARSTTNVDNKRSALTRAKQNWVLNNLPFDSRTFLNSDAIKFLRRATAGAGRYDLVILDPPPRFKQSGRNDFNARTGYARLVARCMMLLEPDGYLLAGLNALTVNDEAFNDMLIEAGTLARRETQTLKSLVPGCDFPYSPDRPSARFELICVR